VRIGTDHVTHRHHRAALREKRYVPDEKTMRIGPVPDDAAQVKKTGPERS
jgi:hypothetical protein